MRLTKPLSEYKRAELNALADFIGIENPASLPTIEDVKAAIEQRATEAGVILEPTGSGVSVEVPEDGIPRIGSVEVAPLSGHPRRAGHPGMPKIGIVDGQAYLLFDRPEQDHTWTDPDGKTHVAKATEQQTAWAIPLGKPVLVNLPESYEQPHYPGS